MRTTLPYQFRVKQWFAATAAAGTLIAAAACGAIPPPASSPTDSPPASPAPPPATAPPSAAPAAAPNQPAASVGGAPDAPLLPTPVPLGEPLVAPDGVPEEIATVWEVWNLLASEHVDRDQFNPDDFTESAIRGLLAALNDPHTNYVRPEAFNIQNSDIQGKFEGIGAHVSMSADGRLQVVAPIAGSPAERSGIRPGDIILEVDGESIAGLSLIEAVGKIRGERGTVVRLLVRHLGDAAPVIVEVERGVIPLRSVIVRSQPGDRFAHIRITNFYEDTADRLSDAIEDAVDGGAAGIVLDVRDNPGGLLSSVVDVTSLFLDDGLILYEVNGEGERKDWEVSRRDRVAESVPMVALANQFSASASEILVGALQDHDRAVVIGATTFGKGSVNILRELNNGGGLFITFARWHTPNGRLISGNGIAPDIEITDLNAREADVKQLQKAMETLESEVERRASSTERPAA